ncbi:MAG: alpha,alpha-trehalase TreF [Bacteroidales bacterium]|nr:alpha,alpha-trehalase TreF [Bacteroidales bacterium]
MLLVFLFLFGNHKLNAQYFPSKALGPIFIKVQTDTAILGKDNKAFVDYIPKKDVNILIKEFGEIDLNDRTSLNIFIDKNFYLPATNQRTAEFKTDTSLTIVEHLNSLWDVLKRDKDIKLKNSSLICLPHQYIVPGGRFREIYYWDSYFTMLGLEVSKREDIIFDMIDNFKFLIDSLGFIPNGNRTYYLSRSQPPFFSLMVELKAKIKGNEVYRDYLPELLKEYNFWMDCDNKILEKEGASKHVVQLEKNVLLNRYWDNLPVPRSESYREDLTVFHKSGRDSIDFFRNIRSACESGWDFSSRWLKDGINLTSIITTEIVPIDLNCLLYHLEKTIALGYLAAQNQLAYEKYLDLAENRKMAIIKYCWNESYGFFVDYNFILKQNTTVLSLAGMYPLFFNLATQEQSQSTAEIIQDHFLYSGGLVSTLNLTGQQWDAPNGWAPLQYISIIGLYNYKQNKLADEIKSRWLNTNEKVYLQTGKMMEKYNVINPNKGAGGGEYPSQDGFGWTNGVYLKLLELNK